MNLGLFKLAERRIYTWSISTSTMDNVHGINIYNLARKLQSLHNSLCWESNGNPSKQEASCGEIIFINATRHGWNEMSYVCWRGCSLHLHEPGVFRADACVNLNSVYVRFTIRLNRRTTCISRKALPSRDYCVLEAL